MVLNCLVHPFRRGMRRWKKAVPSPPQPPRCPSCLESCHPPYPDPESGSPPREAPITIPCSQTYHADCLRQMFSAALNSTPYHPPRCCGTFVPLSMLYKLYPAPAASIVAEKLSEKEAPEAAAASVPPPSPASVPPPNPAVESSTPAEITPIPAPPASLPKLTHKLASFRALTPNPVDCAHCSRWILPEDISEEAETGYCNPLYGGGCGGRTCVVCLEAAHEKWTKWAEVVCTGVPEKERGEVRFRRLVGREGWRECGKCGWTLSRDLGCSEVVCRCGNYETLAF